MTRSGFEMRVRIPARWSSVESVLAQLRERAPDLRKCFGAELVLREALNNAVLHGCQCDERKRITCRIRVDSRRIVVSVRDEGDGFDWRASKRGQATPEAESGRGLSIFGAYATRVRFNESGNAVTIVKRR